MQELLIRNREEGPAKAGRKTVLALLSFHMNGMDNSLQGLKILHENNIRVRICPDEHILEHYNVTDLAEKVGADDFITLKEAERQKEQIDHFYIPNLSFSTVSDVLHFNDTRPFIRLILWALMKGKKVSAFSAGADPYHPVWQASGLDQGTTFLKHEMKKQLQQIKGYGIQLIENEDAVSSHFITAFQSKKNQVITAESIIKQAEAGQQYIELNQGTIITPLARDMARKYQIGIGEKRGRRSHGNGNRGWQGNGN